MSYVLLLLLLPTFLSKYAICMNQRVLFVVVSDLLWYCMVSVIRMVLLTLEKRDCMALVLEGPKEVLSANSPTQSVLKGET